MERHRDIDSLIESLGEDADAGVRDGLVRLSANMQEGGRDRASPVREIFGLLGDRWSTLILLVLQTGRFRHAGLRRAIELLSDEAAISQRILTLKLRALEREGLVDRFVTEDIPPRVDYALTPLGLELVVRVNGLIDWIKANREPIQAARTAFVES